MNNEEQKRSLVLFFTEFLKTHNYYNDDCLNPYIDRFNVENANNWMKKVNHTSHLSSYTDLENDWRLCVKYINEHNMTWSNDYHIIMDGKEYCQKKEISGECENCIFESCGLKELCTCIPCSDGYYEQYIPCSDNQHKECVILDKDNSTGKKYDTGKTRYDLLPPEIMKEIAEILTFGAAKYGDNNWQKLEDFNNRYYAAMERHIQAWRMGEDFDPESGKHHLSHALTNVAFLVWKNINKE